MKKPSVAGKGIDIFFQGKSAQSAQEPTRKITFRIPVALALEFDTLCNEIQKKAFVSKNRLGTLAIKKLIESHKKGNLKSDPL